MLDVDPSSPPQSNGGISFRCLRSDEDYEQCLELQRETWGEDFRELVPPTILAICQKVGGVVAGAFENEVMLGFVYGLTGVRDGELAHWSHMLAVTEAARGRGLGRDLKLYQRRLLQNLGVNTMYWTYDPLIARNASLNLISLGATPVEYVVDMYGADTGSELHSGLGTDRFIVRWPLRDEQVSRDRVQRERTPGPPEEAARTEYGFSLGTRHWIEIPQDIDSLKLQDKQTAVTWRNTTRAALLDLFDRDACCVGLSRDELNEQSRVFYVFDEVSGERE